jgi:predicted CXXCH cytochrome family protein
MVFSLTAEPSTEKKVNNKHQQLSYALRLSVSRSLILCGFILFTCYCPVENSHASIVTTQHNLSITGPGPIKAVSETRICVFCHTPHHSDSSGPLWNHSLSSAASYIVPSSATLLSTPQNPPDGDSRLCLSCHDGTVAIGSVVNIGGAATTISMQDSGTGELTAGNLTPNTPTNFGTDLSGHHPVSIEVDSALINDKEAQCNSGQVSLKVCNPTAPVKLLSTGNLYGSGPHTHVGVQCSSCHDAHEDPVPGTTMFLRVDPSQLCGQCHVPCSATCP